LVLLISFAPVADSHKGKTAGHLIREWCPFCL